MNSENDLPNQWTLWFHNEKNNWTINGFNKLYEINTIGDFWRLYNNWNKIKGVHYKHYFLMKKDVPPVWEDPININGGCWSYKITNETQAEQIWNELSVYLVCNEIILDDDDIVGLSISLKKSNNTVIKIWNKNNKNNSLNLLNKNILKKWGTDIIYIAHMTEN